MDQSLSQLRDYLRTLVPEGVCIAFSGGVDSAVILALACEIAAEKGGEVHAVTMHTPFHSLGESQQATGLAVELGAKHTVIALKELDAAVVRNPPDRCYLCKKWIFSSLADYAAKNGLSYLVDGTNADDLNEYRPGLKALRELQVRSPLAELGIHKTQVREIADSLGISVAKKPSAPCLATRFPYNTPIDLSLMEKIDGLEHAIRALGITTVRVRVYGDTLRIEVQPEDFQLLLTEKNALLEAAHTAGFLYITMDLEGFRSGSMDLPLRQEQRTKC